MELNKQNLYSSAVKMKEANLPVRDVCIWDKDRLKSMTTTEYITSCDNNIIFLNPDQQNSGKDYKFCPYCGGKIFHTPEHT